MISDARSQLLRPRLWIVQTIEEVRNCKRKCEDERPENIEICKYRSIFCRTEEICFHTFTTRNHNSSGRVVEFVVWLFSASFSVYISCLFSNHPICICLFSPLCKNDEEEAAIRGFTDNQHASKESRQQTTRVDMLLYLSRKEFQKLVVRNLTGILGLSKSPKK